MTLLSYTAAFVAIGIALYSLYRDSKSFVHRIFASGMFLFAMEAVLNGIVQRKTSLDPFIVWYHCQILIASVSPICWMIFSLSFGRANYLDQIKKWQWLIIGLLVLQVGISSVFWKSFLVGIDVTHETNHYFIKLGSSGYLWHLIWVVMSIMVLMNLERTFRHATGHLRWQTKFMFLGIGAIFSLRIFIDSQIVLYKTIDLALTNVNQAALLIGSILMFRSLMRGRPLNANIQLSHKLLYGSFTVLIVGIYFVVLGAIVWFSVRYGFIRNINISILIIFAAVIIIASFLLSDRLRMRRKRFISRHLKRPQYNYQEIWEDFTKGTVSITQTQELCRNIVQMVSKTMEILSVTIWLVDEKQESLSFGGSTVVTDEQASNMRLYGSGGAELIRAINNQRLPLDLKGREDDWVEDMRRIYGMDDTKESLIRYCVPLNAGGNLIGIMTLSEKVFYEPLTFEESELLMTIADQAAASLLNLRLSDRLRQVKELEAFQAMSAFFMHDLKNLASKLSLVTQNLPIHIDNPEFRADALRIISQSVSKINDMGSRLSLLSQKVELSFKKTDFNEFIEQAVSDMKQYINASISLDLPAAVLPIQLDREQIHKVIENLMINAADALGNEGRITVATRYDEKWAEISVGDNGCGMSREFMTTELFKPFRTTKKKGMGIGLFHCKTIVEAHGGRIEVESETGKGSTFKVFLPLVRQIVNSK
jgi:putative PEP-CTERM system histidine kinase